MEGVFHVKDTAYAKIKIESKSAEPSVNLINSFIVEEGVHCAVPVLQILFNNANYEFSRAKFALNEGTLCHLTFGRDEHSSTERVYRLWGIKQTQHSGGPVIKANFILDVPTYVSGSYRESFDDRSSDVMGAIAGRGGLSYEGPRTPTNDKQIWLNICQIRSAFAEDVALHGYQSATSAMIRAVRSDKKLLYKNLFEQIAEPAKGTLLHNAEASEGEGKKVYCSQMKPSASNGVFTNWLNYGYKHGYHCLDGIQKKVDKFEATKVEAPHLPINSEVKGKIDDTARVEYDFRLDCGNQHANYVKAMYQNMRGRAMFSQTIAGLTGMVSNLEILDPVRVITKYLFDSKYILDKYNCGKYLIVGKTWTITSGLLYLEKISCVRAGVTEPGRTPMV